MLNHISIDVTDAKECAVPQDKFRINNYTIVLPMSSTSQKS